MNPDYENDSGQLIIKHMKMSYEIAFVAEIATEHHP